MKLAVYVLLLLGFCAGTVLAAPGGDQDEKPWYTPITARQTWYEDENVNNACPGQGIACGDVIDDATITAGDNDWSYFNVAVAGTWLTIGTDVPTMGGSCDTYLELYDVCGGTRIAYDDDGGPGTYSLISNFVAPHSGDYYIKVRGYGSTTTGNYKLFVTCTEPVPPPENDTCEGAIVIERCTNGVIDGDLTMAVNNYDPSIPGPSCTGYSAAGKDLAYVMDLVAGDQVHLFYYGGYDESLYIVTDCADMTTCLIGADETVGSGETIDWVAPADGTYYVIADKYGTTGGGPFTLTYDITCPAPTFVCCVAHTCYLVTETECAGLQGNWHPEWDSCGPPNPCDIYTPAEPNSWGQIKNAYR